MLSETNDRLEGAEVESQRKLDEVKRLKAAHAAVLEETKKSAFEAGYAEAKAQMQAECEATIETRLREVREVSRADGETAVAVRGQIEAAVQKNIQRSNEIIVDTLGEVLAYLYLDKADAGFLAERIEKISAEFGSVPEITVHIHPSQREGVEAQLIDLKIVADPEVDAGDFVIDFSDYLVEHVLKAKIEVIKNEIKKEIEQPSEIHD